MHSTTQRHPGHGRDVARRLALLTLVVAALAFWVGCAKKQPPIARPIPPPPAAPDPGPVRPPAPPQPVSEPAPVPEPQPITEEPSLDSKTLDELNKESPLQPVFFAYDSAEVDGTGREALDANAEILRTYASWVITVEGHCDARGTPEYNLALGERRALAARNYLVSLGIPGNRLRTVSYGKEFPFDPGTTEEAYARNRRAHFVITSK